MVALKILGRGHDLRTDTPVVYAQLSVSDYLKLVGPDYDAFEIQRKRVKHKAYDRMKKDIINGALLPSITLAVKPEYVSDAKSVLHDSSKLAEVLSRVRQVNILDGLQRTHILNDIKSEGIDFEEGQNLHIEFWLEENMQHLVYRIIVLNAGQKPMSMRHQVELLFGTIQKKLQQDIPKLQVFTENDGARRTKPGKFPLDRIATSYHSYILKSPEIERQNIVAQRLMEDEVLDSDESDLTQNFSDFTNLLKAYVDLDFEVARVYPEKDSATSIPAGLEWFGSDNVMNAFFAAFSQFSTTTDRKQRATDAVAALRASLEKSQPGEDPLGLQHFQRLLEGINPKKTNIGSETRRLLANGFKEYFREAGEIEFSSCWLAAA